MDTGAITQYVDVAQLVLYAFWIFFFGCCLLYCLLQSLHCSHRRFVFLFSLKSHRQSSKIGSKVI